MIIHSPQCSFFRSHTGYFQLQEHMYREHRDIVISKLQQTKTPADKSVKETRKDSLKNSGKEASRGKVSIFSQINSLALLQNWLSSEWNHF